MNMRAGALILHLKRVLRNRTTNAHENTGRQHAHANRTVFKSLH